MKDFLQMLGFFIVLFVLGMIVVHGTIKLSCLGEQGGTMVVVGGNSVRCPYK